ncbi:MAG: hypothetical protein GF401_15795 [Chitinivibrionales bacterium]|nr:hypothetical protein [Chitinivibrionales bacterium]
MIRKMFLSALLLFNVVFAIGYQHATFRSQSTQGVPWNGTSKIIRELFRITVYPDYLDIELDWEFDVNGVEPDSFKNALEIVGNINLERGSVVTGMLLWNGDDILKAKLKSVEEARKQYEEVVDRDADIPPPPRDPVIFEYGWAPDNYYMSIFPVSWGGTRKMRMRYLIPSQELNGTTKIGFPHAFSDNAEYVIYKGSEVSSFYLESSSGAMQEITADSMTLEPGAGRYSYNCFRYITPQLFTQTGSRLYVSNFSTARLSGEMVHFIGMTPDNIVFNSALKEEFVILWRWNNSEVLSRYGKQIVEQSNLLQQFLIALHEKKKKVALIIDKGGNERIIFNLDRKGGPEYSRMMSFLYEIGTRQFGNPQSGRGPQLTQAQIDSIVAKSFSEFENALQEALSLFTNNTGVLRHLILVTAGPEWIREKRNVGSIAWDPSIEVSGLIEHLQKYQWFNASLYPPQKLFWPGVDINAFAAMYNHSLTATAVLSNGTNSCSTYVRSDTRSSYFNYRQRYRMPSYELKLFTAEPLERRIHWNIYLNGTSFASFTEKPLAIESGDPMQYARLVGADRNLLFLGSEKPSSMAATLGFVDEEYALLALEEDVLPDSVAEHYVTRGVPDLLAEDIFPSADDTLASIEAEGNSVTDVKNTSLNGKKLVNGIHAQVTGRSLVLHFDWSVIENPEQLSIMLFTVTGKLIRRWNYTDIAGMNRVEWTAVDNAVSHSSYILKIRADNEIAGKVITLL